MRVHGGLAFGDPSHQRLRRFRHPGKRLGRPSVDVRGFLDIFLGIGLQFLELLSIFCNSFRIDRYGIFPLLCSAIVFQAMAVPSTLEAQILGRTAQISRQGRLERTFP